MLQLNPYLNFNGNGTEAMKFYQSVLGGDLKIQTFGQSGQARNDSEKNLLMHAELKNDMLMLYASDGHPEKKVTMGENVNLSLIGDDVEQLTKYYNGLSAGGHIDMPLAKQFWGDTFGMFTDKFGIHWMVNILQQK